MTHQIISIDEYLHETTEIAKRNYLRRIVLSCTIILAFISLGFGIYSSSEKGQNIDNQTNTNIISISDEHPARLGKVFLAFDPDELNGVEDLEAYLSGEEKIRKDADNSTFNLPESKWTEEEVRNHIVIRGNYYAGQ